MPTPRPTPFKFPPKPERAPPPDTICASDAFYRLFLPSRLPEHHPRRSANFRPLDGSSGSRLPAAAASPGATVAICRSVGRSVGPPARPRRTPTAPGACLLPHLSPRALALCAPHCRPLQEWLHATDQNGGRSLISGFPRGKQPTRASRQTR